MQEKIQNKFKFSPKIIILSTVFLDVLGIGLIVPILPFYVESFNVPDIVVTMLFAVFSLFAFFSAPILGMISDRKGRRPVLLISLASSAIGWLIFAFSKTLFGLFLGRIIDGSAAGNISTAQNYLIDISKDQKERTKNLGLIGAIFGIAFIIGPLMGGILSNINIKLPFIVVGIMATINTILAYFFLPETHHDRNPNKISLNPFSPIIKAYKNKNILPLYLAWLFFGVAISLNQSIFALYITRVFSWTVVASGILITITGVILSFNQAFLIRSVWLRYFKESSLMIWALIPFALGYFIMAIPFKFAFLIGLIMTAFCQSLLRVVMTSQIIGFSEKKEQGEMMGILASLMSLSMILGPLIGGAIYVIKPNLPFLLAGTILFITFSFIFNTYKHIKPKEHIDIEPVEAV
ncbi:MAG: MFS transporter [Candidatus Paceibacterota bacterium]|jgi:DHA1 family tetracycline resistance protein-like MFS transporter